MSLPLTWEDVDDEQIWESDKYTVADELIYQSGYDKPPEKEKSADQLHMEHVDKLEQSSTTDAKLNRIALMSQYMTQDELERGQMAGVSNKVIKSGQLDPFTTLTQIKGVNTHGNRIGNGNDDDDGSDSDNIFSDDDDDMTEKLEAIRRQRLLQLKHGSQSGLSSGPLMEVEPEQYESEVKTASNQGVVLMLLYQENSSASNIMIQLLTTLARKFPTLKYTKMKATHQVRNFPLEDCPTLMCYHRGKVVGQFVKLEAFNGSKTTALDIEWRLAEGGIIDSELTENPRDSALFH